MMFGFPAPWTKTLTFDLEGELRSDLESDWERRDELKEKLIEELKYSEITYSIRIDTANGKLHVDMNCQDVADSVQIGVELFEMGELEEDEAFDDE